jgi:hypothetical protein
MNQATLNSGTRQEIAARVAPDPRADGGRRTVLLTPRCISIKRRLRGIKMLLSVPVANYVGLVIASQHSRNGIFYRLSLAHRDPELCITLNESRDQAAIVEAWRRWTAFFAIPSLIENAAGKGERLAGVSSGELKPAFPRRPAKTLKRRSHLLRQRHAIASLTTIFRDEREIICYE